jgi:streptomycin 6-kinase
VSRPSLEIPAGLWWWRAEPGGSEWLERLPRLVSECAEHWSLELGPPVEPAHISLVVPARLPGGADAVLKVNFPEPESEHEPDALARWDGVGAVHLLARDDERRALLVERCLPGSALWNVPEDEAIGIAAAVLRRLWRPPGEHSPFRLLADAATAWSLELPERWEGLGRPFERELLDEAVDFLGYAGQTQGELVLVHQDFHGGNVLRASREPWLAIDPKPLVGEREFDTASLLRDRRAELLSDPGRQDRIQRRLDRLRDELGLDRERMRGWAIAHTLAWAFAGDRILDEHVECARLLQSVH